MFYGLVGLFLMGLGIRAVLQAGVMSRSSSASDRVLLLFGGRSAEHDVSRVDRGRGRRVRSIPSATTSCRWRSPPTAAGCSPTRRAPRSRPAPTRCRPRSRSTACRPRLGELVADPSTASPAVGALDVDVVLPLLHGPYGEDGTVQGLLELADLPYVGSGVVGSAVAMDKVMMKRAFAAAGLPTPRHRRVPRRPRPRRVRRRRRARPRLPVLREAGQHGLVGRGVEGARPRDARRRVRRSRSASTSGSSWRRRSSAARSSSAVLGDDPPEVSVPGEIVPGDEFYSYADKYEADDAELLAPAPLTDEQTRDAQELAVAAFEACRCEAMARVDLFFEEPAAAGFLVNEVNTIPGFTPISMYPRLWEVSGVPYSELLDRLIDLALARHARRTARAGRQRCDTRVVERAASVRRYRLTMGR